jgi:hypothetical protein
MTSPCFSYQPFAVDPSATNEIFEVEELVWRSKDVAFGTLFCYAGTPIRMQTDTPSLLVYLNLLAYVYMT